MFPISSQPILLLQTASLDLRTSSRVICELFPLLLPTIPTRSGKNFKNSICVCMHVHVCMCACVCGSCAHVHTGHGVLVAVREHFYSVGSFRPPCGSQVLNLGGQTWQVPFPVEPSLQPSQKWNSSKMWFFLPLPPPLLEVCKEAVDKSYGKINIKLEKEIKHQELESRFLLGNGGQDQVKSLAQSGHIYTKQDW